MDSAPTPIHVTVIAEPSETITDLHSYLIQAGMRPQTTKKLLDPHDLHRSTTAVVIFPDEFLEAKVVASMEALRAAHPKLLILLITCTPQRFRVPPDPSGRSPLPVAIPKPAFGWTLVDAIRAHAEASAQ